MGAPVWVLVCAAALPVSGWGGQAASNAGIEGTVTDSVTGEPVRNAHIGARCATKGPDGRLQQRNQDVFSDFMGRFKLAGASPGGCSFRVNKQGYWPNDREGGTEPGARNTVALKLEPQASIAGRLVDQWGAPLSRARIGAWRKVASEHGTEYRLSAWTMANDRGNFLVSYLRSGTYYLQVRGADGGTAGYVGELGPQGSGESITVAYYGGGGDIESATPVSVSAGGREKAEWIVEVKPERVVEGRVENVEQYARIRLEVQTPKGERLNCRAMFNGADGRFRIQGLADGTYVIQATQGDGEGQKHAEETVTLAGKNAVGVSMRLRPAVVVSGTVRIEAPSPAAEGIPVLDSVRLNRRSVFVERREREPHVQIEGSSFKSEQVPPGEYWISVESFHGYVVTLRSGDVDLLENPLLRVEPGLTPAPLEVVVRGDGGMVLAGIEVGGEPREGYLALVPTGAPAGRRTIRPPYASSSFEIPQVPPGEYTVVAWEEQKEGLTAAMGAGGRHEGERITVPPGGRVTVKIKRFSGAPE